MEKQDYNGPILEIDQLSISFFTRLNEIPAVMDFSCTIEPGEAMGLVGESGCGKSTVALGVMQDLGVNGRVVGGSIKFKGRDLNLMSDEELRDIRGSEIAMIYQEPMASLNPAMKIGKQLMEVPMIHEGISQEAAYARALEVVTDVKLPDPERILKSFPHQLSGGQQQRIVIAMALMSKPSLLILDEPTTALDVTVEAAVVELVKDLGKKYGTSMLFISHNLGLVLETCDRICVMYSGEAVETGRIEDVFDKMQHPYTQACSARSPCPVLIKMIARLWPFRAIFHCRMNGQMDVTLGRAAIIFRLAAVIRAISQWTACPMGSGTDLAACAGMKSIGTPPLSWRIPRPNLSRAGLFSRLKISKNIMRWQPMPSSGAATKKWLRPMRP